MLLGSHRRGLAAPAPRAVAPTAPPPMAETPPKVWNRLALAALLFMCFAVSHLIATHMKSMITVAPVSVQADLKNRETKSTWDTHIPRVNISAALAARLEEIRAERAAPGYRGRYPGEEAWWGGLRRREKVLVLSPVRRTNARRQKRFVKLLLSLDWDRRDLSVATLVSPTPSPCEAADAALRDAKPPFASVTTYLEPAGLAGLNTGDQESGAAQARAPARGGRRSRRTTWPSPPSARATPSLVPVLRAEPRHRVRGAQMALKMGARVYGRTDVAIKHA
ncbi:hypothetical protein JL720_6246 [Aureococcus anophagefferens]|nr:hypothetical protein JL720_6246 [Aureococcus anophagefferens]